MPIRHMCHTLIAYGLEDSDVSPIKETLIEEFKAEGVSVESCCTPFHISIAQIPETYDVGLLDGLLSGGKIRVSFRSIRLEFLEGAGYNYIAVRMHTPKAYKEYRKALKTFIKVRNFPGGFRAHISLVRGAKSELTKEIFVAVRERLNLKLRVVPNSILLFNGKHEVVRALPL